MLPMQSRACGPRYHSLWRFFCKGWSVALWYLQEVKPCLYAPNHSLEVPTSPLAPRVTKDIVFFSERCHIYVPEDRWHESMVSENCVWNKRWECWLSHGRAQGSACPHGSVASPSCRTRLLVRSCSPKAEKARGELRTGMCTLTGMWLQLLVTGG